ncbi:NAD(P)-binding protein [Saccharata proteae CBS 121410]|uniref:NAD(P)-binding protein n=1 Tax=Saccharata proteae CBS 121410 TaxID=1314787 RepID=A0A9P4LZ90_9PEZI|nr:NAD(P)-binding protein [Saccharata proteae CBS 121410]
MSSGPETVFITGSTGFVGFRVLVEALEAGYHVRASIRSLTKASSILSTPSIKSLFPEISNITSLEATLAAIKPRLTFIEVPDILAPDAYATALKGVDYVIHCASPVPTTTDDKDPWDTVVAPAITGTTNILNAALMHPSIKRIVVTSSIVAIRSLTTPESVASTAEHRVPDPNPLFLAERPFLAYLVSKIMALNKTDAFVRDSKPGFGVVNVMPACVLGPNELPTSAARAREGSNSYALLPVLGERCEDPKPGAFVHLEDVARVHVGALKVELAEGGYESFLVGGDFGGKVWDDVCVLVKEKFPEAVREGKVTGSGTRPTLTWPVDSKKTEERFGFKHRGFDDMMVDTVGDYLQRFT